MRTIISTIIGIVIGIFIGWSIAQTSIPGAGTITPMGIGGSKASSTTQAINEAFNSKSVNLRLTLNNLLREHATMGGITLTALYEGIDAARFMQLMNNDGNQLAEVVKNIYGNRARDSFLSLWNQHLIEYQNYTLARKDNNTTQMNKAKQNLRTIASRIGALFGSQSNNLSATTSTELMQEHINGTLSFIDAVAQDNTVQVADLIKQNYDQAGRFADILSRGMILDKPSLF